MPRRDGRSSAACSSVLRGSVGLAAAGTLLLALGACSARADSGVVVRSDSAQTPESFSLTSPLGQAKFSIGKPVRELSKADTNDRKSRKAPSGGAFVPVTWNFTYTAGFPFGTLGAVAKPATLALVAGGHSYRLDTVGQSFSQSVPEYVAVSSTKDLKFALTYDGLTQTVDTSSGAVDSGRAAGIETVDSRAIDCGKGASTSGRVRAQVSCDLTASTVPWAGGWAAPGHEFVVVKADVRPYPFEIRADEGFAHYRATAITDRTVLDGVAPRQPLRQDSKVEYAADGVLVFDVPKGAHTLHLRLRYTLQEEGQEGATDFPQEASFTLTRNVAIPS